MQNFMITLLICSVTMSAIALFYMGISQPIGLKICDIIGSPMLLSFVRPCILLPISDSICRDNVYSHIAVNLVPVSLDSGKKRVA